MQRGINEFSRMNLESRLLQRTTSESIDTIIQKADIVLVVILYEIWLKTVACFGYSMIVSHSNRSWPVEGKIVDIGRFLEHIHRRKFDNTFSTYPGDYKEYSSILLIIVSNSYRKYSKDFGSRKNN